MDGTPARGYHFDNARMTESCGVALGPLPLPIRGRGEGTELRFVRSLDLRGWVLLGVTALCVALSGTTATAAGSANAGTTLEQRKLPMHFIWLACEPNCRGWFSAVGIVTSDTPEDFDEFARGRHIDGTTVVLDSSGGSVNDAIALGRRWRGLGLMTTVGTTIENHTAQGDRASILPDA